MNKGVQAFDYYRDYQGTLFYGLYDLESGLVMISPAAQNGNTEGAADFLNKCWKVWGDQPPKYLAMDGVHIGKNFKKYLHSKGVNVRVLNPGSAGIRGILERGFRRIAGGGNRPTKAAPCGT